jgi:gliding motility-associated-like protein
LIVSDTGGIDTAVTSITVNYCIDIPNAFSPNSDGLNDVFRVISSGAFSNVDLKIYNRWGQLIFESAGVNNGWDGTFKGIPANVGVYVYTVTVRLANGETFIKNGNVTLLR